MRSGKDRALSAQLPINTTENDSYFYKPKPKLTNYLDLNRLADI